MQKYETLETIKRQLSNDERDALTFLEDAILNPVAEELYEPYPNRSSDVTSEKDGFNSFISDIGIDKLKEILSGIVRTLNAKKIAERYMEDYDSLSKDILAQRLQCMKIVYIKGLKRAFYVDLPNDRLYCLLKVADSTHQFKSITNTINYDKIMKNLSKDEKDALNFLEDSITNSNPDDPDDHNLITHSKQTFYLFVLETHDVYKLKSAISGVVKTLNAKKAAERSLENYNHLDKDILLQRLKYVEAEYMKDLKVICNTHSFEDMHRYLLRDADNSSRFESSIKDLNSYYRIYNDHLKSLTWEEKKALVFLGNSVMKCDSKVFGNSDHAVIIGKRNFNRFIINTNTSKLKAAISSIVKTLDAKKRAEKSVADLNGLDKELFTETFKGKESTYIDRLKMICFNDSFARLPSEADNSSAFATISNDILSYSVIYMDSVAELDEERKNALIFLENSIKTYSPNGNRQATIRLKEAFNNFITKVSTNTLKLTLSDIVEVLHVKEKVEKAIANYDGPYKDIFVQRLKELESKYVDYLRNTCYRCYYRKMGSDFMKTLYDKSEFEDMENNVNLSADVSNKIKEKLSAEQKETLDFLEKSLKYPDPDLYIPNSTELTIQIVTNYNQFLVKAKDNISKFEIVLLKIAGILKEKKSVEEFLENCVLRTKDLFMRRLNDAKIKYMKYLKKLFMDFYVEDIYSNLLGETDTPMEVKDVLRDIIDVNREIRSLCNVSNKIREQLSAEQKGAWDFIGDSVMYSDETNPDTSELVMRMVMNYDQFVLKAEDNINKFKAALSRVAVVLDNKEEIIKSLANFTLLMKDLFMRRLGDAEKNYIKYLKNIFASSSIEEIYSNFSGEIGVASDVENVFGDISKEVHSYWNSYNKIKERLNAEQKGAFDFMEDSVMYTEIVDPNAYLYAPFIIQQRQDRYSKFIQYIGKDVDDTGDIVKFESLLSDIASTLTAKEKVKEALENYPLKGKDILVQRLKAAGKRYVTCLKSLFVLSPEEESGTSSSDLSIKIDDLSVYLLQEVNSASVFENILYIISFHNKIMGQLSDEQQEALIFLENAINSVKMYDPNDVDHYYLSGWAKESYRLFTLYFDNIDHFKAILSDIVVVLNAQKLGKEAIERYSESEKNRFEQILKDEKIKYINYLLRIYATSSIDEICINLLVGKYDTYLLESIITNDMFRYYNAFNKITEQLTYDERNALVFLENSITNFNPDTLDDFKFDIDTKENFNRFTTDINIYTLKKVLLNVLMTLNAKKVAGEIIVNHASPGKDIFVKMLRDAETEYAEDLRSIFGILGELNGVRNDLLIRTESAHKFNDIIKLINSYDKSIEQLNEAEKEALAFLEDSITVCDPSNVYVYDDYEVTVQKLKNYVQFIVKTDDISKLRAALSGIVMTLNAKKEAAEVVKNHANPGRDIFAEILQYRGITYMHDLRDIFKTLDDEVHNSLLNKTDNVSEFKSIIESINSYDKIIEQLSEDERNTLTLLENSVRMYNLNLMSDYGHIMSGVKSYIQFIIKINDISKLRAALSGIVMTLNAKRAAAEVIKDHANPGRDVFAEILQEEERRYTMMRFRKIFNMSYIDYGTDEALSDSANNVSAFNSIIKSISSYDKKIEQLSEDERNALIFLENSIKICNSNDFYGRVFMVHKLKNYVQFIVKTDDISKIRMVLANIVMVLDAKKVAEEVIEKYIWVDKDKFIQMLKDTETKYVDTLRGVFSTFDDALYNSLLSITNNVSKFNSIIETIKSYNKITEQLNEAEERALIFLKNAITTVYNPGDPGDCEFTIQTKQVHSQFIVNIGDISKVRMVLSNIVEVLDEKKKAEGIIEKYSNPGKNFFVQILKDTETKYIKYLKNICNTSSVDNMCHNLLVMTIEVSSKFKNIAEAVESYNSNEKVKQLSAEEKNALTFLDCSIATLNPDNLGNGLDLTCCFMCTLGVSEFFIDTIGFDINITQLKQMLSAIVTILNAKESSEKALASYTGKDKDKLTRMLKATETKYRKYLRKVCVMSSFDQMYNNLLSNANDSFSFEDIINYVGHCNEIIERLDSRERNALDFLEDSITNLNPNDPNDSNLITHTKASFYFLIQKIGIDKFREALSGIATTLDAKELAEKALANYIWTGKEELTQRLRNEEINYIKHLKRICNISSSKEMYDNLLSKSNNAFQFIIIVIYINYYSKTYNSIMKLLDDKDKEVLLFFEKSIANFNSGNPGDHQLIIYAKQNFNRFMLKVILDIGIYEFKEGLLKKFGLVLDAKKNATEVLKEYDDIGKNILIQMLKESKAKCSKGLKRNFLTDHFYNSYDDISPTEYFCGMAFKKFINNIQNYHKIMESLNLNQKDAFDFLEQSIMRLNSDNLNDRSFVIRRTHNLNRFILDEDVSKLQMILSKIILTLNSIQDATKGLVKSYRGMELDKFILRKFKDEKIGYMKHLQISCDDFDSMYDNLVTIDYPHFKERLAFKQLI
ncbi:BTA121 domain-containing protein surface lipoprotein [Borrelia hispanica]|uniref:BTA121 domain-containing protein surface lipoprotein n=1 Tax=Borrelia hispanica TaxID=40835 RepID=UPI0004669D38|nr:hypothetical protein [Borrelia hispanica]